MLWNSFHSPHTLFCYKHTHCTSNIPVLEDGESGGSAKGGREDKIVVEVNECDGILRDEAGFTTVREVWVGCNDDNNT